MASASTAFDANALLDGLTTDELLALQDAAEDRLQTAALSRNDENGLLGLLEVRERSSRKRLGFDAALYIEIADRNAFRTAGYGTITALYGQGVRLGTPEARRRRHTANAIGRFTTMTGERRPPHLTDTASAVADGAISRDHATTIADILSHLPATTNHDDRTKAEQLLAAAARTLDPAATTIAGNRILAWLDPDGTLTDDTDRKNHRSLVIHPQNRQLMSKTTALLTPVLRSKLDVILTQWATTGMNNPHDPESPRGPANQPGLNPTLLAEAALRDDRSITQRQHDALEALCEWALTHTGPKVPDRIPAQIVITVSDDDLARQAGIALTATGTRIPVPDLVEYAAHAIPHLQVFAGATAQILYLGRANRYATHAQRLALFARDKGCTGPACTVPFARTEAHHMPEWSNGGVTDVDHLGAACGTHNRWSGNQPGQWESTILTNGPDTGRVAWRPAGRSRTEHNEPATQGQSATSNPWLVNPIFRPEDLRPGQPIPAINNHLDAPTSTTDTGHTERPDTGHTDDTGPPPHRPEYTRHHEPAEPPGHAEPPGPIDPAEPVGLPAPPGPTGWAPMPDDTTVIIEHLVSRVVN